MSPVTGQDWAVANHGLTQRLLRAERCTSVALFLLLLAGIVVASVVQQNYGRHQRDLDNQSRRIAQLEARPVAQRSPPREGAAYLEAEIRSLQVQVDKLVEWEARRRLADVPSPPPPFQASP